MNLINMKLSFYTYFCVCFSIILLLNCSKNDFDSQYIQKTYVEFPSKHIHIVIPYNQQPPYNLHIPIQIFGTSLTTEDSIKIHSKNDWLIANVDYTCEHIKRIATQTLHDSITLSVASNKFYNNTLYSIDLEIISFGNQIEVSKNNNSCEVSFIKESFSQFFSGTYSCFETSTNSTYEVTFRTLSAQSNKIMNQNFWDFPESGQEVEYIFSLDEQTIEIPEAYFTDKLGNTYTVKGSGTYTLDGNFIVDFFMYLTNGDIYQSGRHIFTKL